MDFSAEQKDISYLLTGTNRTYTVSKFQRPYAWEEKHQIDLLEDIIGALEKNVDEIKVGKFFMGNFIFHITQENSKQVNIVDGQQRLITVTMILSIIRKKFEIFSVNNRISGEARAKAKDLANELHKYLFKFEDGQYDPIVVPLREEEKNYFFEEVLHYNPEKGLSVDTTKYTSCLNFKKGYETLNRTIDSYLNKMPNALEKVKFLRIMYRQIRESQIVILTIMDEDTAYNIYSNINSKGLYLTPIDLIKNDYLYKTKNISIPIGGLDPRLKKWDTIISNVTLNSQIGFEDFFEYAWYILHPEDADDEFKPKTNLFELFQRKYPKTRNSKITKFFNKLKDLSEIVKVFSHPERIGDLNGDNGSLYREKLIFLEKVSNDSISNKYILWLLPLYSKIKSEENARDRAKHLKVFKKYINFISDTIFVYALLNDKFDYEEIDLLSNIDAFFAEIYLTIIRSNKDNVHSNLEDLNRKRMNILQPSKNALIQYISKLSYSKKIQNESDEELIRYLLKRLNETNDGFEPTNFVGSIEHIIEDEIGTNHSSNVGNLVYLDKEYNKLASLEKQNLEKKYVAEDKEKDESFYDSLLTKKFNEIYIKSKYPEVIILRNDYLAIDFNNNAIDKRAIEIATRFLNNHMGLN